LIIIFLIINHNFVKQFEDNNITNSNVTGYRP